MRVRLLMAAALLTGPATGFGDTINGDVADQFVGGLSNPGPVDGGNSVGNPGGFTLKVGTINDVAANRGRNAIYVFQLPNLGAIANPFTSASLSFGLGAIDNNTTANADLYGLTRRDAAPTILAADYYIGNAADTTDATRLQTDILVAPPADPETPPVNPPNSIVSTSATGSANLLVFLNSQYSSGAGAGEYVYLRINPDSAINANNRGYNVHTANDPAPEKRPTITYATSVSTGDADFDEDGDVDGADFLAWQRHVSMESDATRADGDANDDGAVNGDDLTVWTGQFGANALSAAQPVPEPGTIALAGLAAVAWSGLARTKNRKATEVRAAR